MTKLKKRQSATLALLSALGPFQFDTYLPALPALMIFMATNDVMVQLTITASLLGMAAGQLFVGPITDAMGRRKPLLVALSVFIASAFSCLLSTDISWMIGSRFILGFSAAAGFVIVNAYIRDVAIGDGAAKLYSTQAAISSLAPVVAPLVGGQLLLIGDWHIVFLFLVFMGAFVMAFVLLFLPETLPVENRSQLSFKSTFGSWKFILRDSRFVVFALVAGLLFGSIAVFISGAPFALEGEPFHLTPTQYTYAFASTTIVMFAANSINRALLHKFAAITLLRYGLMQATFTALLMIGAIVFSYHSLVLTLIAFALSVSVMGFTQANIMGLAMQKHGERAGVAAGIIGFSTSLFGALAAPLTSMIFGLDVVGVTLFMSILFIVAALLGFFGLRKEKAPKH